MYEIERIKELVDILNYHRNLYYNESRTEISDFEYDNLFDELKELEEETGLIYAMSPTQTVGYEVKSNLNKVKHNHPMLSLNKTKNVDDVIKFLDGRYGVVMAKMDGLTCSLRYLNGELVSAETRGDGETGEDILHCAKTIKNLPLKIECLDEVIVDGEVIITYDDFEKINSTLPEDQKYKHPRNLVSGSIRQLDSSVAAQRNMKFIAWKLIKGIESNSFIDRLDFVSSLGFDTVTSLFITPEFIEKEIIESHIHTIKEEAKHFGYPIDGCVFGYEDVAYGNSLGATGHHLRSQLAFKFYDELYDTKLLYVDWTMGKTNTLNPTAVFKPVDIDGTEVSRASLHNLSIIKSLGFTNGCTVRVYKANQIIPQIDSCERDGNGEIEIPNTCPICGGKTTIQKDNESEVLVCTNLNCSGKLLGRMTHFVSRKCMNIEGLSSATLELLISNGFMSDFRSIYELSTHQKELAQLPGMGAKSVQKLMDSIEKSRNVKLENFLCALGIPNIGLSASKTIVKYCEGNWDKFNMLVENTRDFTFLDDFGKVMSDSLNTYLDENLTNMHFLAMEMKFILPDRQQVSENQFTGKTLCVTGKLNYFTRDSINEKIVSLGAKAASSVSKKTDYLITNEASGSSKYKKAIDLGIPVITEDEFLSMIGEQQ